MLLGQGKIIEALRLANTLPGADNLSARKYLEATKKSDDPVIFYSVYTWLQHRNIRQRGQPDFLKSNNLLPSDCHAIIRITNNAFRFSIFQSNYVMNILIIISSYSAVDLDRIHPFRV